MAFAGGPVGVPPLESGVAGGAGGLVDTMVPAEPLHVPPAASWTVSVGWKVPALYEWVALEPDPDAPSPYVHE